MTKKEAMIILGNAPLLNKVSQHLIKRIYYHPKDSSEQSGETLTKTEVAEIIVTANVVFDWESLGSTLRFGPPSTKGHIQFFKSLKP